MTYNCGGNIESVDFSFPPLNGVNKIWSVPDDLCSIVIADSRHVEWRGFA